MSKLNWIQCTEKYQPPPRKLIPPLKGTPLKILTLPLRATSLVNENLLLSPKFSQFSRFQIRRSVLVE